MRLVELIVTFFFIGHAKMAPGSIASLFTALLFYFYLDYLTFYSFTIIISLTICISFFIVRIYTSELLEKDKSEIVIDEVIGQSIALLPILLFMEDNSQKFYLCFISLLFFRYFDIVKPFPINKFDALNNSFGIIMDDILAGIFSAFLLTLTLII